MRVCCCILELLNTCRRIFDGARHGCHSGLRNGHLCRLSCDRLDHLFCGYDHRRTSRPISRHNLLFELSFFPKIQWPL